MAVERNPTTVVKAALNNLTVEQLSQLQEVASMGNYKTTVGALGKSCFAGDYANVMAKVSTMNYVEEVYHRSG